MVSTDKNLFYSIRFVCWRFLSFLQIYLFLSDGDESVRALSSQELCLRKICIGCIAGSLSCQTGGLTHLPDRLSSDIQSMILIGHRFDQRYLSKTNFSAYSQQTTQLQRLTLRKCAIERLEPGALESIRSLTQVDLSENNIKVIEPFTFSGLRLELLRLDGNPRLRLAPGAFRDTVIVSLSMNQCGLHSLTYEDLFPLLANNALLNLHLSGNNLVTFESQLEPVFLQLQSLSIEKNQFTCNCKLQWLTDVLQRRASRRATRALHSFDLDTDNLGMNTPLDSDVLRPMCQTPERLKGKYVEDLIPKDFYCQPPRIESLEFDLVYLSSDTKVDGLKATFRCQVKGSPELKLSWFRRASHDFSPLIPLTTSEMIRSNIVQIELNQSFSESSTRDNKIERLVCHAADFSGNTSTQVKLQWPLTFSASVQGSHLTVTELSTTKPAEMQPIQDLEIRSNAPGDWFLLTGDDPNRFWTQKQFSALEMISAVVGTFASTLALFVLGCCVLKPHCHDNGCSRMKTPLIHSSPAYAHASSNRNYAAPPPSYSSAPTNSASSGAYPDHSHEAQSPFTNSPIQNYSMQNAMTHTLEDRAFTDIIRMKQASNPITYEPVPSGIDLYSATAAYSDSQTYDTPQSALHINPAPPPNAPLPPIPTSSHATLLTPVDNGQTSSPVMLYTMPSSTPGKTTDGWSHQHTAPHSPHLFNEATDAQVRATLAKTLSRLRAGPFNQTDHLAMSPQSQFIHPTGTIGPMHRLLVSANPTHPHQLYTWTNQNPR